MARLLTVLIVAVVVMLAAFQTSTSAGKAAGKDGFGFDGSLSGFPTGAVDLTGGGAYDPATASNTIGATTFVHSGGGFRCTAEVAQGPLKGCLAGEGVRWDTVQLLASITFKCNGAGDIAHTVVTDDDTVVLLADFYRAGDGIEESFSNVPMFVSAQDERGDLPGDQNVWIAGVGCGSAVGSFN